MTDAACSTADLVVLWRRKAASGKARSAYRVTPPPADGSRSGRCLRPTIIAPRTSCKHARRRLMISSSRASLAGHLRTRRQPRAQQLMEPKHRPEHVATAEMRRPAQTLSCSTSPPKPQRWGCGPRRTRAACGASPGWPLPTSRRAAGAGGSSLGRCTTSWVRTVSCRCAANLRSAGDGVAA